MPDKSQNNPFSISARDLEHILHHAAADFETLRGRNLFLTGGTGFFGKWLLAGLLHANAELNLGLKMRVLSRDPAPFLKRHARLRGIRALTFISGHVADFQIPDLRCNYIFHAAADTTAFKTAAEEEDRARTIVEGTRHVLDLTKKTNARLLYISSGAVYGTLAGQLTGAKETDAALAESLSPYGQAKQSAERICAESDLDFVTARAFAFLGPYLPLDAHFAAGNFLRDACKGGPIMVRGDGTALRSYLYPADLVVWLLRILVRGQRAGAYNVGSEETVTTGQLARHIADAVHPRPEVVIHSIQAQGPQNIYLPDIERARAELNLSVAIPLQDAIARTLIFLKANSWTDEKFR